MSSIVVLSMSVVPAFAATSNTGGVQAPDENKAKKATVSKGSITLCEKRVGIIQKVPGDFSAYSEAYYIMPTDLSHYTKKDIKKGIDGKPATIYSSVYKSTEKNYRKGKTNYALVAQRYDGALAAANTVVYKKDNKAKKPAGSAALDTKELAADLKLLHSSIDANITLVNSSKSGFAEGTTYNKGQNYGVNAGLAGKATDTNHKAPNTFTVSFDKSKCNDKTFQANMKFLSEQRALTVRALDKNRKATVAKYVKAAQKDYNALASTRNKISKDVQ